MFPKKTNPYGQQPRIAKFLVVVDTLPLRRLLEVLMGTNLAATLLRGLWGSMEIGEAHASLLLDLVAKFQVLLVFLVCKLIQQCCLGHPSSHLELLGSTWEDQMMTI